MIEKLEKGIAEKVSEWLHGPYDQGTKKALNKLIEQNNIDEITDAFYKDLDFGTGGLRGIMGVGTNRVNKYTIGLATQGLSNYLKKTYPDEKIKVVIAHDNRNNAEYLARVTAEVFSANDFYVYIFDGLRPTPELSFAIRHLNCHSGIMLTASHNPKEYSGYKAYWSHGGQVTSPHDINIIQEVRNIKRVEDISFEAIEENIEFIGESIDDIYLAQVIKSSVNPDAFLWQHNLRIVFSPIHGTGVFLIPKVLEKVGLTNVKLVEEQCTIDGNFPTVIYPNPEEKEALKMALEKAEQTDAELVMATDPDGDRVGIAVRNDRNEFELLNGNQTGVLLFHYLLEQLANKGLLSGNEYIVKTIVTTSLIDEIAQSKNVECYNVLTGFKYIGELMTLLEGEKTFIAGAEESYGYLIGEHVRDKDAVVACLIIAEMAAFYKNAGKTLFQVLLEIYTVYGLYKEELISVTKVGKEGAEEIEELMKSFREQPPKMIGENKVTVVKDYYLSKEFNFVTGEEILIDLPKSNVMQFITEKGYVVTARPSGTEPKIKYYISVNTKMTDVGDFAVKSNELKQYINSIAESLNEGIKVYNQQ